MPFAKISDLLEDVRLTSKVQKTQFLPAGRYPIVDQSENFIAGYWNDEADVFRVSRPLVLFGDHTRRFKYVDFDFVLGADGVKVLQFDERVLPRYAYFASGVLKLRNLGYSRHYKELLSHEIPLPPLEEQRRIVAEIEGYQQVIDGARQILSAYTPRFIIDPEWPLVEFREAATFTSGGTPAKTNSKYWTGRIPWVSAKDMKSERLADSELYVSDSALTETATRLAPTGSILILVRGMGLANGVPVCELLAPCAFNQDIKAALPNPGVSPRFLAAALRQEETQFKNAMSTAAHGTLKIESEQLLKIQIPLPPLPEQDRIVAELDAEEARLEAVRGLLPAFEAKIQRTLARVWGTAAAPEDSASAAD